MLSDLEKMQNQPDSVLSFLQQIDTTQLNVGDKALYFYLYYTSLALQNKLPDSNTSLEKARVYFEAQNDSSKLCRIYCLKGKINHQHYYLIKAQDDYETAIQYITSETDYRLLIDLKISMGNLYHFYRIYDREKQLLEQASQLAIQHKDSKLITKLCLLKSNLMKKQGKMNESRKFPEEHIRLRDSTYYGRKEELLERMQNLREYKKQQERILQVEKNLSDKEVLLHRVIAFFAIIILASFLFYYRIKQNKNKLKIQLLRTEQERNQSDLKRKEAEIQYLKEKEEKETIALARLNQRLEYFKQLNEITIPILMQNRNKAGALHLQENDWTIIRNNTNACFDHFTERLKELYPQLTEEEINFCCLVKMELPLSVLAEIYHIAKGSISRKKMRLKEKIGIENMSFDEFIASL